MGKPLELIRERFGRLTVTKFLGNKGTRYSMWECVCSCGNTPVVRGSSLTSGQTKSCGCLRKEKASLTHRKHGQAVSGGKNGEYTIWKSMRRRCNDPKCPEYKDYGGRGIKICERWNDFNNFFEDMGDRPKGMSLDRKNNDGDYCPENCRWATPKEQSNNARSNKLLAYKSKTRNIAQWARHLDMNEGTLRYRLKHWSVDRALNTLVRRRHETNESYL